MIKRFTIRVLINVFIVFVLLELISTAVLSSKNYFSDRIPWTWLLYHENHADQSINSDTLFLGCSVGNQLFPSWKSDNYFTSVGPCLTATSFLLADRIINANPNINQIYIVSIPSGLTGGFEKPQTYNSFVKPFYSFHNIQNFDLYLFRKIAANPLALFSVFNIVKILPITNYKYISEQPINYNDFSEFAIHNLTRLRNLTNAKNINLTFVAPPLRESSKENRNNWKMLMNDIKQKGFDDMFEGYFENIIYVPDSCFVDGIHFKKSYINENSDILISKLNQIK